jgi:cytochrome c-type biogenesis protein CcmH/NrfG
VLRLNPNHADAKNNLEANLLNRGLEYAKKGDLDRAIADWEAVLRLDPNNAGARQAIEVIRQARGY